MSDKIFGIDLGTTNSCIALWEDGKARVLEDETGFRTVPSYLAMTPEGRFLVGRRAKGQVLTNPYQTLYGIKRLIGRPYRSPQVEKAKQIFPFEIVEAENGECLVSSEGKYFTPEQILSVILMRLKDIAFKHVNFEPKKCVITVPAYFNSKQREMTKIAGEMAGWEVIRLINEPTAAALAYGYREDMDKKILVYDLGGGTFDVSILEIADNVFEVIAGDGDSFLGGIDFDQRILDYFVETFLQEENVDLRNDIYAMQRLKDAAENAKCELSTEEQVDIILPGITPTANFELTLTREKVEELCQDLVKKTVYMVTNVLQESGLKLEEIDEIVLVGGQTKMPLIKNTLFGLLGKKAEHKVNPDEAVALGAAIHAATLSEGKKKTGKTKKSSKPDKPLLVDVTPHSLGIEAAGNLFTTIIEKNTPVPCRNEKIFSTTKDYQKEVRIIVRQGESKEADKNAFLGEFVLTGIRQAPRMEPKIAVTFNIDTNGILSVKASDLDTGQEQTITINEFKPKSPEK